MIGFTGMFVNKNFKSPHFKKQIIPVEFAILHYTAQSLKQTLNIFLKARAKPVSCHILIDKQGLIYELVPCWKAPSYMAFHAGQSSFLDTNNKLWDNFNRHSLGIELINWNGNIFPFSELQYKSLFFVLTHFKKIYPALQSPHRILGHEHIAGFRGKKDPGYLFCWDRLLEQLYPLHYKDKVVKRPWLQKRLSVFSKQQYQALSFLSQNKNWNDKQAKATSLMMERAYPFWLKKIFLTLYNLFYKF